MVRAFSVYCLNKSFMNHRPDGKERSGSVVECFTRDSGATGSSLTGVTVLCPCP